MKTTMSVVAALLLIVSFVGCTTIGNQQMSYVGDLSSRINVVGTTTHVDFIGIGVSGDQYAMEHNAAVAAAFKNAPLGTQKLENVKVFRAQHWTPQVGGLLLGGLGSLLFAVVHPLVGIPVMAVGALGALVNYYDYVVIGEPSK